MKNCGCSSEVDPLRSLLLKRPRDAFHSRCEIERQWRELGYAAPPDLSAARLEYDAFVALLEQSGCEIAFLPFDEGTGLDSIYVRDTALMIPRGAVLMNMGKSARRSEPARTEAALREMGIPILGAITDPGTVEGGDVVVFDEQTLAVGQGYRTNPEGIRQLRGLTRPFMKDFVTVPLPHWKGPGDVLHLMSFISPVDHDLAVVYSRMMPVPFREWLLGRGIRLVEVPDEEYESMACNVLAVAPRRCLMLSGNPLTRGRLEAAGAEVWEYRGEEISRKGAGGPTCLTRPLWRSRDEA